MGYKRFQKYLGTRESKLYQKMDLYLAGTEDMKVYEVEELDNNISDEDFVKQWREDGAPKVFRGVAKDWPAVQKWDLDFFEKNYGNKEVEIMDHVGMAPDQEYEKLYFGDYIRQIKNGSLKYLKFSEIVNENDELKSDFDLQWLRKMTALPVSWGEDLKTFMGIKGTITPFHIGFSPVLFVNVMGRKKWTLYPPSNRLFVDARTDRSSYMFSNVNPNHRNDPQFPLYKYAHQYEIILEPGDVLWFPSFTWHYVENLTTTIGIRYGRGSMATAWKSSKLLTAMFFMVTKPSIPEHLYNTYIKKKLVVKDVKPGSAQSAVS